MFVALQMPIMAAVIGLGRPEAQDLYLSAFSSKLQSLEDHEEPKLIVLGGSNVAFSLEGNVFNESIRRRPVLLGLHASLGMEYQFEIVKQLGQPGDVALLVPEVSQFYDAFELCSQDLLDELIETDDAAAPWFHAESNHSWKDWSDREALELCHTMVRNAYSNARDLCKGKAKTLAPKNVYSASNFDQFGSLQFTPVEPQDLHLPDYEFPTEEELSLVSDKLNAFASSCKERGIDVFISAPPMAESRWNKSHEVFQFIEDEMRNRSSVPWLVSFKQAVQPDGDFYDSVYHLRPDCRQNRTSRIASSLTDRQPALKRF